MAILANHLRNLDVLGEERWSGQKTGDFDEECHYIVCRHPDIKGLKLRLPIDTVVFKDDMMLCAGDARRFDELA